MTAARLPLILSDLQSMARANPGETQRRQLGHGLQVLVRLDGSHMLVGCARAGKPPADAEMDIVLRDCQAPDGARRPTSWERATKAGFVYVWARWPAQLELFNDIDSPAALPAEKLPS